MVIYILKSLKEWQIMITEYAIDKGFEWEKKDVDTMLLRIHSELSEAAEAVRDEEWDKFAEELADVFIRLANCAEVMGIDLENEIEKKHQLNLQRPPLHGRKRK
jgi:NTP pyrophosphatase (non-canonical NTP hydrolase)